MKPNNDRIHFINKRSTQLELQIMRYRRTRVKGGIYFFTVVTYQRQPILTCNPNVQLLREAFRHIMDHHPFIIEAFVLLPDHLHCIWSLPHTDSDYSKRWQLVKGYFSRRCDERYKRIPNASQEPKKEQAIWQRRFWEHMIRDEADYAAHAAYIHYNPVKHGFTDAPGKWPYSNFHKYVRQGLYKAQWGAGHVVEFDAGIGGE